MKKKTVLFVAVAAVALAGCGNAGEVLERTVGSVEESVREAGTETGPREEAEPGAEKEPGQEAEPGTEAESGTEKESREEAGAGAEKEPGKEADSGAEADPGTEEDSVTGAEVKSGSETGAASCSEGEEFPRREANEGSVEGPDGAYGANEPKEEQYTWQEYTVTLPRDWVGRCVMEEHESGFAVYQKASHETDGAQGYICGFFRTQEPLEYEVGSIMIAYTEDGALYYMDLPMDVNCDAEDETILEEYVRMCQQTPQLKTSLRIAASGVHGNADEYMLSTSSILGLEKELLASYSEYSLWIAENEIYARHGMQFDNGYLQHYFDRCTWYKGEIPEEEFRESVLNQTEKNNLRLISAARQEYARQHPYPKMYQASETAKEDLNGDGTREEISCQVVELEMGELQCEITVNGETYVASGLSGPELLVPMSNPMTECFYITDIREDDGTLEIAVLDEGPSDDPITYFYRYDGTLSCIGQVFGFPFADMNEGGSGFNGYGSINGCLQTDLIECADVQGCWRYDDEGIVLWDWGWYDYLPDRSHKLYEDLPVYFEREETSATTVIPAQEQVFFLGTDMERWILVKGKDGSQGYMAVEDGNIVGLNKPAGEVFSDLYFYD